MVEMVSNLISDLDKSIKSLETMKLETQIKVLKSKNVELRSFFLVLQIHIPTAPLLFSNILVLQELPFCIWVVVTNLIKQFSKDHDSIIDDLTQIVRDLDELSKQAINFRSSIISKRCTKLVPKGTNLVVMHQESASKINSKEDDPAKDVMIQFNSDNDDEMIQSAGLAEDGQNNALLPSYRNVKPLLELPNTVLANRESSPEIKIEEVKKMTAMHKMFAKMIQRGMKSNGFSFGLNDLKVGQNLVTGSDSNFLMMDVFTTIIRPLFPKIQVVAIIIGINAHLHLAKLSSNANTTFAYSQNLDESKPLIFDPGGKIEIEVEYLFVVRLHGYAQLNHNLGSTISTSLPTIYDLEDKVIFEGKALIRTAPPLRQTCSFLKGIYKLLCYFLFLISIKLLCFFTFQQISYATWLFYRCRLSYKYVWKD